MKKQLIALFAFVAIPAATFAQTADDVLTKHIAALGGQDKINAVKTAQYEQTMSVMGQELTAKTAVVVGKSSRSDLSIMGQQITNVVDGDKGWAVNPMMGGTTPKEMTPEEVKLSKANSQILGTQLAYLKQNKYPYELVGKEKRNDKDVFNIKVSQPEGTYNYYIDANTYQLLGSKALINAQGQQAEAIATYSDFKQVDGLTVPFTAEISSANLPAPVVAKMTKLTLNAPIDPAIFALPK
ncbi:DUF4292 domain-containing protein [Fibrisoma montanum]|uniref:DUF4292 domain-containing protein n=1 Tax=Fibrisoma montanum TaxID=2305895 RepID=A0A418LWE4_9BACT|nr:DUF4292 domain-containing protein [Fibrisoma montanum]RIV17562.1 DUF4292 domain-containing protein [Fibrisoma montanum]